MTYQAYLDTIKAKTGKTPEDFRLLAAQKGLVTYPEIMAWLKSDFGLGHGHANVIAQLLAKPEARQIPPGERIAMLFSGNKAKWREPFDALVAQLNDFGTDVKVAPTHTYISLLRGENKFGIVQPSADDHIDIGIKLKGVAPSGRLAAAGTWNSMVTHRVPIREPDQIDAEILTWLKQAYDSA
jgi:hypothetical protein